MTKQQLLARKEKLFAIMDDARNHVGDSNYFIDQLAYEMFQEAVREYTIINYELEKIEQMEG